jgi:hypothetical protein
MHKSIRGFAMLRYFTFVIVLVSLPTPLSASKGLASYAEGKSFVVGIEDEDLLKSPAWKSDAQNPPLSARKAIELATEQQKALVKDSKGHKWEFVTADLTPDTSVDRWYWEVTFTAHVRPGGTPPGFESLRVIVLMDGRVLKPVIKPYPL